jgi:hypothetical protein
MKLNGLPGVKKSWVSGGELHRARSEQHDMHSRSLLCKESTWYTRFAIFAVVGSHWTNERIAAYRLS